MQNNSERVKPIADLTAAEVLVLAILAEADNHAYGINQLISRRNVRKWADVGFSSVYYLLQKLETKGLCASEPSQGKEKKTFALTRAGRRALKVNARHLLTHRQPANTSLMVGLASSHALTKPELAAALEARRSQMVADLEALDENRANGKQTVQSEMLFSLSRTLLTSEISWIDDLTGEPSPTN